MELTRQPVEPDPAPVVNAISGVGILLDLQNQNPGVDRVHLPAAHENGIAGRHSKVMHARFDGVVPNRAFELRARDAAREADD